MLLGAMALGEFGAMIGLAASLFALSAGLAGGRAWIALAASVVGVVGAALPIRRPRISAVLQVVAAIGGLAGITFFFVVAAALFAAGATLAFLGRSQN